MDKFLWGQVYVKGALVRPPGAHDNSNDHYQQAMVPTCWNCEGVLWLIFCDALVKDDQHLEDRLGVVVGEPRILTHGATHHRNSRLEAAHSKTYAGAGPAEAGSAARVIFFL